MKNKLRVIKESFNFNANTNLEIIKKCKEKEKGVIKESECSHCGACGKEKTNSIIALIKVPVAIADVVSRNNTIYTRDFWTYILETQKEFIKGSFCLINHPESYTINKYVQKKELIDGEWTDYIDIQTDGELSKDVIDNQGDIKDACGVWQDVYMGTDGVLWGVLALFGQNGQFILDAINSGAKLGFSTFALGELELDEKTGLLIPNKDNYVIMRLADVVIRNSVPNVCIKKDIDLNGVPSEDLSFYSFTNNGKTDYKELPKEEDNKKDEEELNDFLADYLYNNYY